MNSQGIRADSLRVSKIENIVPRNKKDLMKILGIIQWFRPYLRNISLKTSFLSEMIKKSSVFKWNELEQSSLEEIICEINKETLLNHPNFEEIFILMCDASEDERGSVLVQSDKLIGFFSVKWNVNELNYSIAEKETLIVLKSFTHFKSIIFSSEILVKTDSKNSIPNKELSKRQQRWKLLMESYNYRIEHIDGESNVGADLISRLRALNSSNLEERPFSLDYNEIESNQFNDGRINNLKIEIKLKLLE